MMRGGCPNPGANREFRVHRLPGFEAADSWVAIQESLEEMY